MLSLKAGIEDLKQAKTLMSEANHIMSDHISKLKALEEENVALKAELDDWKGNAEGFEPDAYMKLPLDADGEPIRFGDVAWYVGSDTEIEKDCPLKVAGFVTLFGVTGAFIETREYPDRAIDPKSLTHKKPELADSWERLEEDAKQRICSYFGVDQENTSCEDCPYGSSQTGRLCWRNASLDMIARAKKLAGIGEEAER